MAPTSELSLVEIVFSVVIVSSNLRVGIPMPLVAVFPNSILLLVVCDEPRDQAIMFVACRSLSRSRDDYCYAPMPLQMFSSRMRMQYNSKTSATDTQAESGGYSLNFETHT